MTAAIRRLGSADVAAMRSLNRMFAEAFEDFEHYGASPPPDAWLEHLLANPQIIVLVSEAEGETAGGLVAYALLKFEQARTEIYIYDMAVAERWRRQGIATALIVRLQSIAAETGAWVIYVQADTGDDPAIALYTGLGTREDVLHFDIPPRP